MSRQEINVAEWINNFLNDKYTNNDFHTQCEAGWYDWFCRQTSLRGKTYRMGQIIKQVKKGGKVDIENWYVWFKNNCPMSGPLYDDFRFARMDTGDVMFTIQINCCWNKKKYTVWGRKILPSGEYENHFGENNEPPMFETDSSRELVKWLNTPWEQ